MANFWDDLVRNVFGGGNKSSPSPAPKSPAPKSPAPKSPVMQYATGSAQQQPRTPSYAAETQEPRGAIQQSYRPLRSPGIEAPKGGYAAKEGGPLQPTPGLPYAAQEQQPVGEKLAQDTASNLRTSFPRSGERTVRHLTTQEWADLTPEQQKGVIASWAIYQASLEDQTAEGKGDEEYNAQVSSMFGEGLGSDRYAPNTVKVLQALGYQTDQVDLDNLLDHSALATYEDILGQTGKAAQPRLSVFDSLSQSTAFSNEGIVQAIEKGSDLLDALRTSGSFNQDLKTYGGVLDPGVAALTPEDTQYLGDLLTGMASRNVWGRLKTEPDLNNRMKTSLEEATQRYGSEVVARFFQDSIRSFDNTNDFMTPDEFRKNWMKG